MNFKERTLTGIKSLVADLKQMIANGATPARTVSWFYRDTAPIGWAICDGRTVTMNDGTSVETPNLIGRYPLGATSGIGSNVSAGLPNITGYFSGVGRSNNPLNWAKGATHGAFYHYAYEDPLTGVRITESSTSNYDDTFGFDASKGTVDTNDNYMSQEDSPYGKSDTVTPPSVKLLPCMKL